MEFKEKDNKIIMELTKSEGLILSEAIYKLNKIENKEFSDAENRVLWDIEASFESLLVEPFYDNYDEIIKKAEDEILK